MSLWVEPGPDFRIKHNVHGLGRILLQLLLLLRLLPLLRLLSQPLHPVWGDPATSIVEDKVFFWYLVCMTAYHHSQRLQAELLGPGKHWLKYQNFPDILGLCQSPGQGLHKDKPWTRFADHHHCQRHCRHRHPCHPRPSLAPALPGSKTCVTFTSLRCNLTENGVAKNQL